MSLYTLIYVSVSLHQKTKISTSFPRCSAPYTHQKSSTFSVPLPKREFRKSFYTSGGLWNQIESLWEQSEDWRSLNSIIRTQRNLGFQTPLNNVVECVTYFPPYPFSSRGIWGTVSFDYREWSTSASGQKIRTKVYIRYGNVSECIVHST